MRGKERKITRLRQLSTFKFSLLAQIRFPHFGRAKLGRARVFPSLVNCKIGLILWLAPWASKMNQILHYDWLTEWAIWSYLARSGLPAESRTKNWPKSHLINPLLTKLVRSRWLDIGVVLFCEFMDRDGVEIHKLAKKNLTNIQPSWPHTWSITPTYSYSRCWTGITLNGGSCGGISLKRY